MNTDQSYTFEALYAGNREWMRSSGRWDTLEAAAAKAGEFLVVCAENAAYCAVRTVMVEEFSIIDR